MVCLINVISWQPRRSNMESSSVSWQEIPVHSDTRPVVHTWLDIRNKSVLSVFGRSLVKSIPGTPQGLHVYPNDSGALSMGDGPLVMGASMIVHEMVDLMNVRLNLNLTSDLQTVELTLSDANRPDRRMCLAMLRTLMTMIAPSAKCSKSFLGCDDCLSDFTEFIIQWNDWLCACLLVDDEE